MERNAENLPSGHNHHLSIAWDGHKSSILNDIVSLYRSNTFMDCSLSAEGEFVKAHKLILSACSSYFQAVFEQTKDEYPIVILRDVKYEHLKLILDFIYTGQVKVCDTEVEAFVEVAQLLQIKGLDSRARQSVSEKFKSKALKITEKERKIRSSESSDEDIEVIEVVNYENATLHQENASTGVQQPISEATFSASESALPHRDVEAGEKSHENQQMLSTSVVASAAVDEHLSERNEEMEIKYEDDVIIDENFLFDETEPIFPSSRDEDTLSRGSSCTTPYDDIKEEDEMVDSPLEKSISQSVNNAGSSQMNPMVRLQRMPRRMLQNALATMKMGSQEPSSFRAAPSCRNVRKDSTTASKEVWRVRGRGAVIPKARMKTAARPFKVKCSSQQGRSGNHKPQRQPALMSYSSYDVEENVSVVADERMKSFPMSATSQKDDEPQKEDENVRDKTNNVNSENEHTNKRVHLMCKCANCKKMFEELKIHHQHHTKEQSYKCSQCNKRFMELKALRQHSWTHSEKRRFKCEICSEAFEQRGTLEAHLCLHVGEVPFKCSHCDKKFVAPGHLQTHMRVHKEESNVCEACGSHFRKKELLKRHKATCHVRSKEQAMQPRRALLNGHKKVYSAVT